MPRALALTALAALLPSLAAAQPAKPQPAKPQPAKPQPGKPRTAPVRRVDVRGAVAADASIRLVGGFGSLRVVGWDRDSLVLTGTVPEGTRVEPALGTTPTPARGAKLYVELPAGYPYPAAGALELRVPARARLWLKAGVADVVVSGVRGALDVNVVGGSIAVTGSPRELRAEAMDGTVTVDGAPEWLRVKTASGDVTVRGVDGIASDVGIATVSGVVHVPGGRYERVRVESVTGAVVFGGALERGGALDVETHSGDVTLSLRGASAEVDIATLTGTVTNKLTPARPIPGREGRGQQLAFTLGGGSARVVVRSFKGGVHVLPDVSIARPR